LKLAHMNVDKKVIIGFVIFVVVIGVFMYYQFNKGIEALNSLKLPRY